MPREGFSLSINGSRRDGAAGKVKHDDAAGAGAFLNCAPGWRRLPRVLVDATQMTGFDAQAALRDRRFRFKYARPRIAAAVLLLFAAILAGFAFDPAVAFSEPDHGRRSSVVALLHLLPPAGQSLALAVLSLAFVYPAATIYLPCIVRDGLVVFAGDRIAGFDRLGRIRSIPVGEIRSVAFRSASAFVAGRGGTVRVPLGLLQMDGAEEKVIRSHLRDVGGG